MDGDFFTGFVIGVLVLGSLKAGWFLLRSAWWLLAFVVLSVGAGIAAVARAGGSGAVDPIEPGHYSDDHSRWQDEISGRWYACSATGREHCEIRADDAGYYWRRSALMRLLKRGVVIRSKFCAVRGDGAEVVAEEEFPREARVDISLDNLDPAVAATESYGLSTDRELAVTALRELEAALETNGWEPAGHLNEHWYADVYERPAILWDRPLEAPVGV